MREKAYMYSSLKIMSYFCKADSDCIIQLRCFEFIKKQLELCPLQEENIMLLSEILAGSSRQYPVPFMLENKNKNQKQATATFYAESCHFVTKLSSL